MLEVRHYETPRGLALDGLTDPVDAPRVIRVVVRPNMKSIYPLATDILTSLGADRDMPGRGKGVGTPTTCMTAWSIARGITDVYLGEVQDAQEEAVLDAIEFAQRIGANVHLFYAFGEVYRHARALGRLGSVLTPFDEAPRWLSQPEPSLQRVPAPDKNFDAPEDDWVSFRAAYHDLFPAQVVARCDAIYRASLDAAHLSNAMTPDALCALIGGLWTTHNCEAHERVVAVRGVQAGAFLAGWNVRVNLKTLDHYVRDNHFNPLAKGHYRALSSYADPWRSAAAVLHAHGVTIAEMRETAASRVGSDGSFPGASITDPEARATIAAQKWAQLVGSDEAEPPFLAQKELAVRAGIKKVTTELGLPLVTQWRRSDDIRLRQRTGITMERYA